jgi:N-acyl-D-amino-acid deacylase
LSRDWNHRKNSLMIAQSVHRMVDTIIRGGLIVDGTGAEPYDGEIGITGERIVFIRKSPARFKMKVNAKNQIDAQGMIVCPGFIDAHAHSDFTLLADPRAEGKVLQGITTEINGNCGLSAAPLYGEALQRREEDLRELGIKERWTSFREYFALLRQRGIPMNFLTLVGHGNIRACVLGYENRRPTDTEIKSMCSLLTHSVKDGAAGLSTGLIYPPGVYADTAELVDLSRALSSRRKKSAPPSPRGIPGIYTTHMRSEGDALIESIQETLTIGKKANTKVHISHIKTSGERNWHKADEAIAMIEKARKKGMYVTADRYPYIAASTDLDTVLPDWTYEGGNQEELKRIKNPAIRDKIKKELLHVHPEKGYWNSIRVSSVMSQKNAWMEGKSIAEIAGRENVNPVDMLFRILIGEQLRVSAIFLSMQEENLRKFLSLPYVMIGTDSSVRSFSGPTCKGKPHPRGFGSFPRFIGEYVRDNRIMRLQDAISKITTLPAQTFGIQGRGVLRRGAYADIVLFDYAKIRDRATFDEPFLKPEGIHSVIVNGKPVVWEGATTKNRPGKIVRYAG